MDPVAVARDVVSRSGWLSQTPLSFRESVLEMSHLRAFGPAETIYVAGDAAGGIYGLVSGGLKVVFEPNERIPFFAHFVAPGSWIGEAAAITGEPRLVTLVATRETQTLYLPIAAVTVLLSSDPDAFRCFAKLMQRQLATAIAATGDLMIRNPTQRLVAILLRLCDCRLSTPVKRELLDVDISQDELAFMANVGRTRANAVLTQLRAAGLIDLAYRRLRVLEPDRLRRMVSE